MEKDNINKILKKPFFELSDDKILWIKKRYGRYIKSHCVVCRKKIGNDLKRYWRLGNSCLACSGDASRNILKDKIKRNYTD